ncbi:MAG: RDD family protein [Candidatus Hodarchaeota archaeon]
MAATSIDLKGQQFAGTGSRIIALFIDLLIVGIVGGIITYPLLDTDLVLIGYILEIIIFLVYFVGLTHYTDGQTAGKMVMNIRVMALDENNVVVSAQGNWVALFLRCLLYIVDVFLCCLIGIILVFQTQNKQRLGDMIAKTVVVRA